MFVCVCVQRESFFPTSWLMTPKYSMTTLTKQEHSFVEPSDTVPNWKSTSTQHQLLIHWPHSNFSNCLNVSFLIPLQEHPSSHCSPSVWNSPSFPWLCVLDSLKETDFSFSRMTLHLDQSDVSLDTGHAFLAGKSEERCCAVFSTSHSEATLRPVPLLVMLTLIIWPNFCLPSSPLQSHHFSLYLNSILWGASPILHWYAIHQILTLNSWNWTVRKKYFFSFMCLFIHLSISVWTYGFLFYSLRFNPVFSLFILML